MTATTEAWTAPRLYAALRDRFAEPEWVLFPHVRDRAGFDGTRTADAVAMNLWPSRGLVLAGFEIKASRGGDWLRELKQLDERVGWYVVAPKDTVRDGELPPGWGLLIPRGRKLVAVVAPAPVNGSRSRPIPRDFVATIFRRAADSVSDSRTLKAEYHRGFDEGMKAGGKLEGHEVVRLKRELEDIRKRITAFEKASGLRFWPWDGGRLGEAVRAVLNGEDRVRVANQTLHHLGDEARRLAAQVDRVLDEKVGSR